MNINVWKVLFSLPIEMYTSVNLIQSYNIVKSMANILNVFQRKLEKFYSTIYKLHTFY